MSAKNRVFVVWSDPKSLVAYKENFKFPFPEFLRLASGLVAKGTLAGSPCDGTCGKEKQEHLHIQPTVRDVKNLFDLFQDERPVDIAFAERKFDGIARYISSLKTNNPSVDLSAPKTLFEGAAIEFGKLMASGAKDYRKATLAVDEAVRCAQDAVLASLAEKAHTLLSGASESTRADATEKISAALAAGGREGIRQLAHYTAGWEAMVTRLSKWGQRNRENPSERTGRREFLNQRRA
jgi:hypothetical protein